MSNPPMGIQNLTARKIWDFHINATIQTKQGASSFGVVNEMVIQKVYFERFDFPDSIVYILEKKEGIYTGTFPNNLELQ